MSLSKQEIAIIGGGAAGFLAAITCAMKYPRHRVTIYEKSDKLLAKVRVSGGGRCNVTHACFDIRQLVQNYPRGGKELMNAFARFSVKDTILWFEERGVKLKTEEDGRMFPVTDNSETIIHCLLNEAEKFQIIISTYSELTGLSKNAEEKFVLKFKKGNVVIADKVLIAAGGHPKSESLHWLAETGHELIPPVPSLFTFNIPNDKIIELMGVSVSAARLQVENSKYCVEGPLLITHWGMSGPAVLKLSSVASRDLAKQHYEFDLLVSWITNLNHDQFQESLLMLKTEMGSRQVHAYCPVDLPKRLWIFLLNKTGISEKARWADLSKEQIRRLNQCVVLDHYKVSGKTTFKEEFVTCGGVSLRDVDFRTMESRKCDGIYFAGEVLDMDALTGGFNFQSAWTTGFIAGSNMGK